MGSHVSPRRPRASRPRRLVVAGLALAALLLPGGIPSRAASDGDPRIVNGLTTHDFPTTGALLYGGGAPIALSNASSWCSGTLIGCSTFLTAAHCVEDDANPAAYWVFLQHSGLHAVTSVTKHPNYTSAGFPAWDVAVLKLAAPVTGIDPTALATTSPPLGTTGTIAGYGQTSGSAGDYGIKRYGDVSTVDCTGGVPPLGNADLVCWRYTSPIGPPGDDSNTCNGDSGGPLFVQSGGTEVVAGITSGGTSSTCLATDFSYDTNVFTHRSWILGRLAGDSTATCGGLPAVGTSSVVVTGFDGPLTSSSSSAMRTVTVPEAADRLRVSFKGDDLVDADLYVKQGATVSTTLYDCRVVGASSVGACEFPQPATGTWSILVRRNAGAGSYQVTATVFGSGGAPTPTPTPEPPPTPTPPPGASPTPAPTGTPPSTPVPGAEVCRTPGLPIPDGFGSATDTMTLAETTTIADLDLRAEIDHPWVGDLSIRLTHLETGTSRLLVAQPGLPPLDFGCDSGGFAAWLDDEASSAVEAECSASGLAIDGTFRPNATLAAFDGEMRAGTWRIEVGDASEPDAGTLDRWCLRFDHGSVAAACGNGILEPGEACDDGNLVAGDCCSPACLHEAAGSACDLPCTHGDACDGAGNCVAGPTGAPPSDGCTTGFGRATLKVNEARIGRESLSLKLSAGPPISTSALGDPTSPGGTSYAVCIYDDAGGLAGRLSVDRGGATCGTAPCWKAVGANGFAYRDKDASASGVSTMKFLSGKSALLQAAAANNAAKGQMSLSTGIAAALSGSTAVTLQVHAEGGSCFSATLPSVTKDAGGVFAAK